MSFFSIILAPFVLILEKDVLFLNYSIFQESTGVNPENGQFLVPLYMDGRPVQLGQRGPHNSKAIRRMRHRNMLSPLSNDYWNSIFSFFPSPAAMRANVSIVGLLAPLSIRLMLD